MNDADRTGSDAASPIAAIDPADLRAAVVDGLRAYFAGCRVRVDPFVDRHFTLRGSLALHRAALGWDVLRAPANLFLALPQAAMKAGAAAAGRLGAAPLARSLAQRTLLLRTDVARKIDRLIRTELLGLPEQPGAPDALAEAILADPRVAVPAARLLAAIGQRVSEAGFRARLEAAMQAYGGTRAAAAEITTGLLTLGAGAATLNKLTPGAVTLGPALAAAMAQQSAIAAFPLGTGLGGLWYGAFPAAPSLTLVLGLTGGLMAVAATAAAFAGLVADPIQRRLGLHRRRLLRMVGALERQAFDPASPAFAARDQYVARLLDLFDLLGAAARVAHG